MADRPILFSAPMIRALLAGTKTQTRRLLTPRNTLFDGGRWPNYLAEDAFHWDRAWVDLGPSPAGNPGPYLKLPVTNIAMQPGSREETVHRVYPAVQPGDRLWVREGHSLHNAHGQHRDDGNRWGPWGGLPMAVNPDGTKVAYYREGFDRCDGGPWRPSIHMHRWASRLTLTVTELRVQQLQEISEADATAEGMTMDLPRLEKVAPGQSVQIDPITFGGSRGTTPYRAYRDRWETLNGPGSWEANPWVVAVSFDVRKGNIDG